MPVRKPLGEHLEIQEAAAKTLASEGPLTHEELRDELGLVDDRERMQAVFRGLSDNGLLKSRTDATGQREYVLRDGVDIDAIFDIE